MKSWDEMTKLEQLTAIYVDMHKDVYGVKARWAYFGTVEEARRALDLLEEDLKEQMAADARAQEQAALAFEERVADIIRMGAGDRETAIRWIHDAEQTGGDDEYLCYKVGLKYGYFRNKG